MWPASPSNSATQLNRFRATGLATERDNKKAEKKNRKRKRGDSAAFFKSHTRLTWPYRLAITIFHSNHTSELAPHWKLSTTSRMALISWDGMNKISHKANWPTLQSKNTFPMLWGRKSLGVKKAEMRSSVYLSGQQCRKSRTAQDLGNPA